MLILAIDTSGKIASCALLRDGSLLARRQQDSMMDHSRLLLPLCQQLLQEQALTLQDVDVFACIIGPGSFTGVRIGAAAVKGFCWSLDKPCAGVSSLLAMAYGAEEDGRLCCSLRARPGESFFAVFERKNGRVTRLTEDAVGTDAEMEALCAEYGCTLRPRDCQNAVQAAFAAWDAASAGALQSCHELSPAYLRLPQAERLRKERLERQ